MAVEQRAIDGYLLRIEINYRLVDSIRRESIKAAFIVAIFSLISKTAYPETDAVKI